jgi:CHAT domain-containing protein
MVRFGFLSCCIALMVMVEGSIARPSIAQVRSDVTTSTNAQKTQPTKAEADRLLAEGDRLLWKQAKYSNALESYQKALGIYQVIGDRKGEGYSLRGMGNVYANKNEYLKAIEFYKQALDIAREVKDQNLEARMLNNLGLVHQKLQKKEEAIFYFEESLKISRSSKNFTMIAMTATQFIDSYGKEQGYIKARSVLQDALKLELTDVDKARLLYALGNTYLSESNEGKITIDRINSERKSPSPLAVQAIPFYQQAIDLIKKSSELELQGDIYDRLANAYLKINQHSDSIRLRNLAISVFQKSDDKFRQLISISMLINTYLSLTDTLEREKNYSQALKEVNNAFDYITKALKLANELNQESEKESILRYKSISHFRATRLYLEAQNLGKAKEQTEMALELAEKSRNEEFIDYAMVGLMLYSNRVGNYKKITEIYRRKLETARSKNNPYDMASALQGLATSYSQLGDFQKSLQMLEEAQLKVKEITPENRPDSVTNEMVIKLNRSILMGFAGSHRKTRNDIQQLEFTKKALELSRKLADPTEEFEFLIQLSDVYISLENYNSAQETAQQAFGIAQKTNQPELLAKAYIQFSQVAVEQGNSKSALELAQKSLDIIQNNKPKRIINDDWVNWEIHALNVLKYAYRAQNNYTKELEMLKRSVEVSKLAANPTQLQGQLQSLGSFYLSLGDYKSANNYFQNFLKLAEEQQYPIYQQGAYSVLSQIAFARQDTAQAIQFSQRSLEINRKMQYSPGEVTALLDLSRGYGEARDDARALSFAQEALNLATKIGDTTKQKSALQTLAELHRRFGRWQEAEVNYESLLGMGGNYATTYAGLAKIYVHRKQPSAAIAFYKKAIKNLENHRRHLRSLSTDLQQSYLQRVIDFSGVKFADIYRELADLLISQGRIGEAQEVLELLKIQELNDFTKSVRSPTRLPEVGFNVTEKAIITQHGSLIEFSQNLETCRNQKCSQLETLKQQRDQLNIAFNNRLKTIEETTAKESTQEIEKKSQDVRANTAALIRSNPNSLVIYPIASSNKVNLIWAGSGGVPYALPSEQLCPIGEAQFFGKIREFHSLIKTKNSDIQQVKAIGKELYDCLVKPLEPEIKKNGIKHLIFVPDRATNYIPMGALFDGEKFLIERFSFSSSLSVETTDTSPSPLKNISTSAVLGLGVTQKIEEFPALGNVETEIRSIVKLDPNQPIGIFTGVTFFDDKFTRSALEDNIRDYTILHIATHGEFVASNPKDSYLLLGQASTYGDEKSPSYRYPIVQIQNLTDFNNLHLVVLSACETGLIGKDPNNGIEIMGISSFFLGKNKAKAVIASLWKVDDASTSLQMQRFYHYLAQGKTKAQALQQAQIDLLNIKNNDDKQKAIENLPRFRDMRITSNQPLQSPKSPSAPGYTHPYYWAPFILIGNSL